MSDYRSGFSSLHAAPQGLFRDDPWHRSLRLKKLRGYDDVWSARITGDYRAVAIRRGNDWEWLWIGTHAEFDRRF